MPVVGVGLRRGGSLSAVSSANRLLAGPVYELRTIYAMDGYGESFLITYQRGVGRDENIGKMIRCQPRGGISRGDSMFLVKVALGAVVALVTVLIVLATLIEQAAPPANGDVQGPTFLLEWFGFLLVLGLAWAGASWALRGLLGRKRA